jgi:hypothetical protein
MKYLVITFIFILPAMSFCAAAPTQTSSHFIAQTPMDKLQLRLRHQVAQIQREARLRKLTKDQAKTLKAQVEAIRRQEMAFLKQNGTKTLTDAQVNQLNGQLNTLSKSIPIK